MFAFCNPEINVPLFNVRFVGQAILAEIAILPVVLLPIVSKLAVIRLSSAWDRPSLVEVSVPSPRSKPDPSVWISTFPDVVAFTVPLRFELLAVRMIRPPLE